MKLRLHAALVASLIVGATFAMPSFAIGPDEIASADIRKLVDVKSLRGAKGATKVAVPGYRVIFTTRSKVVARAEDWLGGVGGGRSSGAKATMEVVLGNVDFPLLQSIVDKAHADFLADLKEGGFDVVPTETIVSSPSFAKINATGSSAEKPYTKRSRDAKTDYLVVSPSAIPLWFTNWDGDISDQGMRQNNIKAVFALAKELDAVVLYPIMHVDFATLGASGGKFARRASVDAKATIFANPAYTLFFYAGPKGASSFARITDGIGVEGDPGNFVKADEASNEAFIGTMQKIGIDFGPVKSRKNMVMQANRDNFASLAIEALTGTNEAYRRALAEAQK